MRVETSNLRRKTLPTISSAKTNLENAYNCFNSIQMPENFTKKSQLNGIQGRIEEVTKAVNSLRSHITNTSDDFDKAKKKANALSDNLQNALANLSILNKKNEPEVGVMPLLRNGLHISGSNMVSNNVSSLLNNSTGPQNYKFDLENILPLFEKTSKDPYDDLEILPDFIPNYIHVKAGAPYLDWDKYNKNKGSVSAEDISKLIEEIDSDKYDYESQEEKVCEYLNNNLALNLDKDLFSIEEVNKENEIITITYNQDHSIELFGLNAETDEQHEKGEIFVGRSHDFFHGNKTKISIMENGEIFISDETDNYNKKTSLNELANSRLTYSLEGKQEIESKIKKKMFIKKDAAVKAVTFLKVNGQEIKVFWIGDDMSEGHYISDINRIEKQLSCYPTNVLNYVVTKNKFVGIGAGTRESNRYLSKHIDDNILGFSDGDMIYLPHNRSYGDESTVQHEFAHVLDRQLDKTPLDLHLNYSETNKDMLKLYKKYKKTIQKMSSLETNGYTNEDIFPKGVPNVREFFATTVELYFNKPDDLEQLLPDVYDYIDDLFKNI